jgi:hypothetical protein
MSSTVLNRVNDVEPSLVLFGRDPAGKPRASWFDAGSIDFATSAAELMHMKILRIITEEQRALAKQLPRGRIFSSGRAFAPFAQVKIYNSLLELERKATHGQSADGAIGSEMSTAAAMSSAADRDGNGASATADKRQAASRSPASSRSRPSRGDSHRPKSWDEIEIGSLVLATTGIEDGWWEAIIESIDGDILTCRWRDYPTEPNVLRRRSELALLPPDQN